MRRWIALSLAVLALAACGMKGDPVAPKDAGKSGRPADLLTLPPPYSGSETGPRLNGP
jgi:hypothetical protein